MALIQWCVNNSYSQLEILQYFTRESFHSDTTQVPDVNSPSIILVTFECIESFNLIVANSPVGTSSLHRQSQKRGLTFEKS